MKIFMALTAVLALASASYAQTSPESYLNAIPPLPQNTCQAKTPDRDAYLKQINDLLQKMKQDIKRRKKEAEVYADANRDKAAAEQMARAGVDGMPPAKKGKMSREERKAMADQMMRQYGLDPEQTRKLKKMSKEEKAAWAQNYAGTSAARAQSDDERNRKLQSLFELQTEQRTLTEKITVRRTQFTNRFKMLDREAAQMKASRIDPLQRKHASMSGIVTHPGQAARMDELWREIQAARVDYCRTYAPQYSTLVGEYLADIKALLPDYHRLDSVIAKTQFGEEKPAGAHDGLIGIEAVADVVELMEHIYQFDLTGEP